MNWRIGGAFFFIIIACALSGSTASAATLDLQPASGTIQVDDMLTVRLMVNTEGVAINAAESTITFPTSMLQVDSVNQTGIFSFWAVNPTYSNTHGTINFSGGLSNPGYAGTNGTIITIQFRVIGLGTATIATVDSRVLANDGSGTDVLDNAAATVGTFTVTEREAVLPDALTVTSPTHPDSNRWYANADPIFTWNQPDGVTGYSYQFDDQSNAIPDTVIDTTDTSRSFTGIGDGIWYFHIRARNADGWGPTTHFQTQIDTTGPEPFILSFPGGTRLNNQTVRVSFSTIDPLSGLAYYEVQIGNGDRVRVEIGNTEPYTQTGVSYGVQTVTVYAVDRAGNETSARQTITVVRPNPPVLVVDDQDRPDTIILNTINEILPKPVRDIGDQVGKVVKNLQQNKDVVRVIEEIITPVISTTAIVTATGVATTVTALQLGNVAYLFLRLGYLWFVPVAVGKRRKPWGIVFDSTTNQPLKRSIVRLFSREFNKLKETQITDVEGRFGFLVEQGKFFVTVERQGYTFPSQLLRSASVTPFEQIYLGDTIDVKDSTAQTLAINVPIDPDQRDVPRGRILWLRLLNNIGTWLERISIPLLVIGTLASWATLIVQPETNNYLFLMVYGLLIIMKYLVSHHYEKSWGTVLDAETNEPIELGVVRIYNVRSGTVTGTRVTNASGLFQALVAPGKYYIVVVKSGYQAFQSKPIVVTKERGVIRMTVKLQKKAALGEQQPESSGSVELQAMGSDRSVFTPPPQHPVDGGAAETTTSAQPTSDSPFAPPTLHEVQKQEDSFAPPPKKKSDKEEGEKK